MPEPVAGGGRSRIVVWLLGLTIAGGALGTGIWLGSAQRQQTPTASEATAVLAASRFATLDGRTQSLGEMRGQILVVNFWATWCPPCREEIPGLIRTQTDYAAKGVQVVGIAVDSIDKTREYAAIIGINYTVLMGSMETLDLVRSLGNKAGALPFTVIVDRRGNVAATHLGLMSEAQLAAAIQAVSG